MVTTRNELGTVTIAHEVITLLTGEAAVNCLGVKGMTIRSVTDGLVHLLRRESMGKGVKVTDNGDNIISIELHIAVGPNVNIPAVCSSIQSQVRFKVESASGVQVRRVDVFVDNMIFD